MYKTIILPVVLYGCETWSITLREEYRKNWKEHVDRMSSDRIPKMILKYQPKGKRNLERLLKSWKDTVVGLNRPNTGKEVDDHDDA
jgi:hypothetical protein